MSKKIQNDTKKQRYTGIAQSRDHEMAMRIETRARKRVHRTPCWIQPNERCMFRNTIPEQKKNLFLRDYATTTDKTDSKRLFAKSLWGIVMVE